MSRDMAFCSIFWRFLPIFSKTRLWSLCIRRMWFVELWASYKSVPRTHHNTNCEQSYDHFKFEISDFFASFGTFSRILENKPSGSGPTGLILKYVTQRGFSAILNTIGLISRYPKPKNLGSPQKIWVLGRAQMSGNISVLEMPFGLDTIFMDPDANYF